MGCGASAKYTTDDKLEFIEAVECFQGLESADLQSIATSSQVCTFTEGKAIITQGAEGSALFVIKKGQAKVEVDGKEVAKVEAKGYVGEASLLKNMPCCATVSAVGDLEVLKITRQQFLKLGLNEKMVFKKRGAVGGGNDGGVEAKPPVAKSEDETQLIIAALKKNKNVQCMFTMDDDKCRELADVMWKETVKAGTAVVTQGDLAADYFYVVESGKASATVANDNKKSADRRAQEVARLEKGGSFGELALMYRAPRAATVTATEDCVLWVVDRTQFRAILTNASACQVKKWKQCLDKLDLMDPLTENEKTEIAHALNEETFTEKEVIFKQGQKGKLFYILLEGTVKVEVNGEEKARLEPGSYFGERSLLSNEPRAATVTVTSRNCTCLTMDKVGFEFQVGPLEELRKRGKDGAQSNLRKTNVPAPNAKRFGLIKRADLKVLGLLGCGGFGAVEAVAHKQTKEVYAMKALSKGYVLKTRMQASVISEKNIQLMCDSPFVVKLYETYNSEQLLYLLLEIAIGGELYETYNRKSLFGNVKCAKFYVAGTVYAFEHLHERKIIYRDLKPENLLLNNTGQVKLTDMGLAKVTVGQTFTTCGTPDYFAPEVISGKGHGRAVDWWTLGILTFELLAGQPPFESAMPQQIYQKVQSGIDKVRVPDTCKGPAIVLIKGLCHADPKKRLPMKGDDETQNIKACEWYKGFDWAAMQAQKMDPPYKPSVKSNNDVSNFKARPQDKPPQIPYKDPGTGWDKGFATSS